MMSCAAQDNPSLDNPSERNGDPNPVEPGKLVVFSGPSGVGKSTVVRQVLSHFTKQLRLSVSATTRSPRPGETDGVHYHFISLEQFSKLRKQDEFVECIEVFGRGHWYGTLWSEVRPFLAAGKWVLLEIDVDGAEKLSRQLTNPEVADSPAAKPALAPAASDPSAANSVAMKSTSIFLRPASFKELEERLRNRGTENEEAIQRRLSVARRELELADRYEHQVINDTVEQAVEEICQILQNQGLAHD